MGDDRSCNMKGMGIVPIKYDRMMQELREVRYVPQLKKNLIFVGALEVLGLKISVRDGILKMTRGSMVVLKNV